MNVNVIAARTVNVSGMSREHIPLMRFMERPEWRQRFAAVAAYPRFDGLHVPTLREHAGPQQRAPVRRRYAEDEANRVE